jgi:hypothetical protein
VDDRTHVDFRPRSRRAPRPCSAPHALRSSRIPRLNRPRPLRSVRRTCTQARARTGLVSCPS